MDPILPTFHSPCPTHGRCPCKALCNTPSLFNKLCLENTTMRLEHQYFWINQATGWQVGSAAQLPKSLCATAMGQRHISPVLGVQDFTQFRLPLALSSACQLGKTALNSLFLQGVLEQVHCANLLGTSCISPRQRLLGDSYGIKMVFEQVRMFQAAFGGASMDFCCETLGRRGAGGVGMVEERSPALSQPRQTPFRRRRETPSPLLSRQVFLWYLPLTGPLGVWQRQQQRLMCPGAVPACGTLHSRDNIPTTVTGSRVCP